MNLPIEKFYPLYPLATADCFNASATNPFGSHVEYHSSGRSALFSMLAKVDITKGSGKKIWLPRFFCPSVVRSLYDICDIEFFEDLPTESEPRFDTITPKEGDAVMAVNFFGLRNMDCWVDWKRENPNILLFENLSHVPFSKHCGVAKETFASLRKTLPLADGGVLFTDSPKEFFLKPASEMSLFASDFLAASVMRSGYASYGDNSEDLFYSAEAKLEATKRVSRISKYSMETLFKLNIPLLIKRRADAVRAFATASKKYTDTFEVLIFNDGDCPDENIFQPILKFKEPSDRDKVYNSLRKLKMFAPIYWGGFGNVATSHTLKESHKLLCVPIDFRHTEAEASAFAEFIYSLC